MMPSWAALCLCFLSPVPLDGPTPLPEAFLGRWHGTLRISPVQDKEPDQRQAKGGEVAMELYIEPLAEGKGYTWRITYGSGPQRQVRDYVLVPDARKPNTFVIDERNGILIDAKLVGQGLFTQFKVQNSLIVARYERRGEAMEVEILAFDAKTPRTSKPTQGELEVTSYSLQTLQRAELKRAGPDGK